MSTFIISTLYLKTRVLSRSSQKGKSLFIEIYVEMQILFIMVKYFKNQGIFNSAEECGFAKPESGVRVCQEQQTFSLMIVTLGQQGPSS